MAPTCGTRNGVTKTSQKATKNLTSTNKGNNRRRTIINRTTKARKTLKKFTYAEQTTNRKKQINNSNHKVLHKKVRKQHEGKNNSKEEGTGTGVRSLRRHIREDKNQTLRRGLLGCDMGQNRGREASIKRTGMGIRINKR